MTMRPKTVRRLILLLAIVLLIGGAVIAFLAVSQNKLKTELAQARVDGMAAFEKGDYEVALRKLSRYLGKSKTDDADALFAYGTSRFNVIEPDRKEVPESKGIFLRYLELRPGDAKGEKSLLKVYITGGYDTETIALADQILLRDPNDVEAMKAKVMALSRLRRFDQAISVAYKLNELNPLDMESQIYTYTLMWNLHRPKEEFVRRAESARERHPNDPRFELLEGWAYRLAGDPQAARRWATEASKKKSPDDTFVKYLAALFDDLEMYNEAQRVLAKAVEESNDPMILLILVQRMWQDARYAEVVDRLKNLDPSNKDINANLLAYKALALYQLGRPTEAKVIVDALANRRNDRFATCWTTAIKAKFETPNADPREQVTQFQAALRSDRANPVVLYMLAESYATLGEYELAIQNWKACAESSKSWARPHVMIARMLVATGRSDQALKEASDALDRAPNQSGAVISYLIARFGRLTDVNDGQDSYQDLLEDVEVLRKAIPDEPETLPIYVTLLSKVNPPRKADAIKVVSTALASAQPLTQETLLRLAAISSSDKLGLEQQILEQAERKYGLTPQIAVARAMMMVNQGQQDAALKYLQGVAAAAKSDQMQWELVVAQFRESIRDAGTLDSWIALGNKYPKEMAVQTSILRSMYRQSNRDFWASTIDRVHGLTGDEGLLWKTERARWLLSGDASTRKKDSADAAIMLSEIVRATPQLAEPRRLWAISLENVGNITMAIEQLKAAVNLKPGDPTLVMELVRLLQQDGKNEDARAYLDRLSNNSDLNLDGRKQIATLLAAQGKTQDAIDLLEKSTVPAGVDWARDLLLAELYRRGGRSQDASTMYLQLLDSPSLSVAVIQSASDFYAQQGQIDQAKKFIAKLPEMNMQPGGPEVMAGSFYERIGEMKTAQEQFAAAVKANTKDPRTWQILAGYFIRRGNYDEAIKTTTAGKQSVGEDKNLDALAAAARTFSGGVNGTDLLPLVESLSRNPQNEAVLATFTLVNEARKKKTPLDEVVIELRKLADQYPQSLQVQTLMIQAYLQQSRVDRALTIATRAMQTFPTDAEPARLLTSVYANGGRWGEMLIAARQWRERSLESPLPADLVIVEALLKMNNPGEALNTLAPYVESAKANPQGSAQVLQAYARGLIAANRSAEASAILQPLARKEIPWRKMWLELASTDQQTAASATEWIDQIAPLVGPAPEEQFVLALARYNVGRRFDDEASMKSAWEILKKLSEAPDVKPSVWLMLAAADQRLGNLAQAEVEYRKALDMDVNSAEAMNNLAYLLLLRGDRLNEASELAKKAISLSPNQPTFYDTLARIHARMGNREEAIKAFTGALNIDPNNLEALIGLADVQAQAGKIEPAKTTLDQIDRVLRVVGDPPPALRAQLQQVRSAVRR